MINSKTFLILTLTLLCIGGVSYANFTGPWRGSFVSPTISAPGDNHEWEAINIGPDNQDKAAGLTVATFLARADAFMQQETIFLGALRGGTVPVSGPGSDTTIKFGDHAQGYDVSINTLGKVRIQKNFQSDTLIASNPNEGPYVCSNTNGTLMLCQDRCANFPGVQPTVPTGWDVNPATGDCVQDDSLPIGPGSSCQYQMIVKKTGDRVADFDLYHNGALYTYTDPSNPISNMQVQLQIAVDPGNSMLPVQNFLVPHGHLSHQDIVSVQDTTTTHYTLHSATVNGVQPATINGQEVCWVGF